MNWFDALRYLQGVLFREHDQFHDVEMLRGRSFRVESDEGEIPVEADGELAGWLPMEFSIRPGGLRVIVPG
jgi:diacylglycerol kinase family enzyme